MQECKLCAPNSSFCLSVYLWTSTNAIAEAISFFLHSDKAFKKCPQPNYYKHLSQSKYFPDYPLLPCCLLVLMLRFSHYPFQLWQLHHSCYLWKDSNKMLWVCTTQIQKNNKKRKKKSRPKVGLCFGKRICETGNCSMTQQLSWAMGWSLWH